MSVIGNIDEHLDEVFGIIEKPKKEVVKTERVVPVVTDDDSDLDFQYARENLYNLIERGQDGLDELLEIAKASQHPRAFEVLSNHIKAIGDVTDKLMRLQKQKKELTRDDVRREITNNNVFVGSTTDLQRMLLDERDEGNIIDAKPESKT